MSFLLHDEYAKILHNGEAYPIYNVFKKTKTKTLRNNDGFTLVIKTENMRISPKTFWNISGWDAQFQENDANCWLCNWYGGDGGECNCKKSFSVDEHRSNMLKARRNYFLSVFSNYFKEYKQSKLKELSDEQIHEVLFTTRKDGIRRLMITFPHWASRAKEVESMRKHIEQFKFIQQ